MLSDGSIGYAFVCCASRRIERCAHAAATLDTLEYQVRRAGIENNLKGLLVGAHVNCTHMHKLAGGIGKAGVSLRG
jgi:hypothetical protein